MSYLDRLKPCRFVSPSGIEFNMLFDDLSRGGGKKASVNEILDSDDSVTQDQGNIATRYPVTIYFAEPDYDEVADDFFEALSERYSLENPGIFYNPRWGSIQVFPLSWEQKEQFVNGAGRAVFTVDFVRIYPYSIFQRELKSQENIVNKQNELLILTQLAELSLALASVRASVSDVLDNTLGRVSEVIKDLLTLQTDLIDTVSSIQDTALSLLDDIANNSILVMGNVQLILQQPAKIIDTTMNKINSYSDMVDSLIEDYKGQSSIIPETRKNTAIIAQHLIGFACISQAISALYTEYETRENAINAIEKISYSYEAFLELMDYLKVTGNSEVSFSGNHDFLSIVETIEKDIIFYLLEKSFSLSGLRKITLNKDDNIVSLCYRYYKNVNSETIEKFIVANNIVMNEFILIPAGRQLVFYND